MVLSSKQGKVPKTLKKGKVLETVGSGKRQPKDFSSEHNPALDMDERDVLLETTGSSREQPMVLCNKPKQFIYRELRIIIGEQKYKTKGQAYEVVGL